MAFRGFCIWTLHIYMQHIVHLMDIFCKIKIFTCKKEHFNYEWIIHNPFIVLASCHRCVVLFKYDGRWASLLITDSISKISFHFCKMAGSLPEDGRNVQGERWHSSHGKWCASFLSLSSMFLSNQSSVTNEAMRAHPSQNTKRHFLR